MLTRRLALAALTCAALTVNAPALGEGKKSTGGPALPPLIGIDGSYNADGRSADGSRYTGIATIVQQGDAVEFTWLVDADTIHGQGFIEGRVVTVDWGAETPVVYVVMPDGELHGTWDDGLALEKLTPR